MVISYIEIMGTAWGTQGYQLGDSKVPLGGLLDQGGTAWGNLGVLEQKKWKNTCNRLSDFVSLQAWRNEKTFRKAAPPPGGTRKNGQSTHGWAFFCDMPVTIFVIYIVFS